LLKQRDQVVHWNP